MILSGLNPGKNMQKAKAIPASIEPKDTIPVLKNIDKKTTKQTPNPERLIARTIPSRLATPFPPLNLM